ncbi:hypothetical protein OG21DRAFT_102487 [Imleria badia]|nr:hypothetical protein OG21DRAFT_102487 [Imleria badia]
MDSDSPQDIYAKCLPSDRGYPLWFPEPSSTLPSSYKQDGLQIGDVGYVSREGTFRVLLNICFGANHALHQRRGVSCSFDPVVLDIDSEVEVNSNAVSPGCVIFSSGITQPNQTSQRNGHYEFTPSSAKGAILILPDGATSHDVLPIERFRKVAMERAFDWYEIAEELDERISSGSLYLITGFYKARSWSLGSFNDATGAEHRNIRVLPREGEGTIAGREWKPTFSMQHRDGPRHDHHGNVNQTVFIRGFKIAVREDALGWMSQKPQKPEVQRVPADRPREAPCCFTGFLVWLFCKLMWLFGKNSNSKRPRRENGGVDVNHVPYSLLSQPFHPSDTINRYLLNKASDALVAVTHDRKTYARGACTSGPPRRILIGKLFSSLAT